jgi:carbamoyl-phosphate synthase small subunit
VSDDEARLLDMARHAPDMSTLRPIPLVSVETQEAWEQANDARWTTAVRQGSETAPTAPHVVVVDCGVKSNILRCLVAAGARVTVAPEDATPDAIRALQPDGLLIANGPGDPEQAGQVIDTVQALLGELPVLGICMGHQVLALALGARTYKLPFGHHGGNHPVQNLGTGEVEITAQNHNFAVDPDSLADLPVDVTHRNLYDGTVEGLRHRTLPITSVQYHPEASPGPHDSLHIISAFVASLHAAQGA